VVIPPVLGRALREHAFLSYDLIAIRRGNGLPRWLNPLCNGPALPKDV